MLERDVLRDGQPRTRRAWGQSILLPDMLGAVRVYARTQALRMLMVYCYVPTATTTAVLCAVVLAA